MSRLGILDLLGLAATLVFAIPVGLFGIEKLLAGDLAVGLAGIGIAVAMVAVEQWLWTPGDVAGDTAQGMLDRVLTEPEEGEQTADDGE
jgi:hypothetical protein